MNERLIALIEYLIDTRQVFNNTYFGDIIGKSKSQVSEMLSGKRPISRGSGVRLPLLPQRNKKPVNQAFIIYRNLF